MNAVGLGINGERRTSSTARLKALLTLFSSKGMLGRAADPRNWLEPDMLLEGLEAGSR
jgi:hypothetical protein